MIPEYRLPLRLYNWLRRFRQRCGYGIHSPFAFEMVTGVVYSNDAYYAYETLAAEREHLEGLFSEKDDQLLFRLANFQAANSVGVVGASMARSTAYLKAARSTAHFTTYDCCPSLATLMRQHDLVVVAPPFSEFVSEDDEFFSLPQPPQRNALLVVWGIHRNARATALWEKLTTSAATTVTFDLYRVGVAFARPKLNRQHYCINYF